MVSSTLFVEGFLYTIEQFFRARDALGGIEVDVEVFNSLLLYLTKKLHEY